jgi:hypothetical protein
MMRQAEISATLAFGRSLCRWKADASRRPGPYIVGCVYPAEVASLHAVRVMVEPRLGWVWLSQTERRAAEQALSALGPDGTRDELGFGVIHFAYADRFFPGTSVQHTQLRYVWFICWSYLELQHRWPGGGFPRNELERLEDRIGRRLLRHYGEEDGHGIIGGRVLRGGRDRSPVVKPSVVYWNAMRTWGLVSPLARGMDPPGRGEVHGRWSQLTSREARPEVDALPKVGIFVDPPPRPARWWSDTRPLSFDLDGGEAELIRQAWKRSRRLDGSQTLLSRLAERKAPAPASMTDATVLALCDQTEKTSLRRARRAGALAAIARALHTAMVQALKDDELGVAPARRWLDSAVQAHGPQAAELDLDGLLGEVPEAGKLVELIIATQKWLAEGAGDFAPLTRIYTDREMAQKPGRALLAPSAGDRRAAWRPRELGPLTYRWERVSGFLDQLAGR